MIWSAIKSGGRWAWGLLAIVVLYWLSSRSGRKDKKSQIAGDRYWKASTDTINSGWRDAEKYKQKHIKAQAKAKRAKAAARKVRDAVANSNTDLDDLFDEYSSSRVPVSTDTS